MDERHKALRVLVADDDVDAAQALASLLPYLIHRPLAVIVAFDGAQAAQLATGQGKPHVVLMDIEMPVMDGFQAAGAIKQVSGESCPVLIAVSGDLNHVEVAARGSVFDHAFVKPVDLEVLATLLNSLS